MSTCALPACTPACIPVCLPACTPACLPVCLPECRLPAYLPPACLSQAAGTYPFPLMHWQNVHSRMSLTALHGNCTHADFQRVCSTKATGRIPWWCSSTSQVRMARGCCCTTPTGAVLPCRRCFAAATVAVLMCGCCLSETHFATQAVLVQKGLKGAVVVQCLDGSLNAWNPPLDLCLHGCSRISACMDAPRSLHA
eukprot:311583-Chlamydomonas_euryale.AAC.7